MMLKKNFNTMLTWIQQRCAQNHQVGDTKNKFNVLVSYVVKIEHCTG